MGYAAGTLGEEPLAVAEGDPEPGCQDVLVYNVSVHLSPNGHACTYVGMVDSRSKRFLSTKLVCYQLDGLTRVSALRAVYFAVIEALHQARSQGV